MDIVCFDGEGVGYERDTVMECDEVGKRDGVQEANDFDSVGCESDAEAVPGVRVSDAERVGGGDAVALGVPLVGVGALGVGLGYDSVRVGVGRVIDGVGWVAESDCDPFEAVAVAADPENDREPVGPVAVAVAVAVGVGGSSTVAVQDAVAVGPVAVSVGEVDLVGGGISVAVHVPPVAVADGVGTVIVVVPKVAEGDAVPSLCERLVDADLVAVAAEADPVAGLPLPLADLVALRVTGAVKDGPGVAVSGSVAVTVADGVGGRGVGVRVDPTTTTLSPPPAVYANTPMVGVAHREHMHSWAANSLETAQTSVAAR